MALNASQLKEMIINTLKESEFSAAIDAATELLLMTAAVESNFGTYIKQIKGPALGIFQVEPSTHDDLVWRYLPSRPTYLKQFLEYCWTLGCYPRSATMQYNLKYAIVLARLKYLSIPAPMPNAKDIKALAEYWKKYYNTHLGAGTVDGAIKKYNQYCK